jgi:hypothetical protein
MEVRRKKHVEIGLGRPQAQAQAQAQGQVQGQGQGPGQMGGFFPMGEVPVDAEVGAVREPGPQADPAARLDDLIRAFERDAQRSAGRVPGQAKGLSDPELGGKLDGIHVDPHAPQGVRTYGWKMFEDEHEDAMRQQDVEELLRRLREAAQRDMEGTSRLLERHPVLATRLGRRLGLSPSSPTARAFRTADPHRRRARARGP